jgi:2-polyprenyl-3-methyl-5-hydroxy-6-metoxy-1,4-benzoquinol methylase
MLRAEAGVDDVATYNVERWRALAEASALFTRPLLDLDAEAARRMVDSHGWLERQIGPLAGKRVLCLAGGGGRQGPAFALLGAEVTVADLSEAQLARDRAAAAHYGLVFAMVQADMRDLSAFNRAAFDVVVHAYSLNFVPDAPAVFKQVARVLRPGGVYQLHVANPLVLGLNPRAWNGQGYPLTQPYADGARIIAEDEAWVYRDTGAGASVPAPREYRHTLGTLVNGLVEQGFAVRRVSESESIWPDPAAEPGTWDHFVAIAPPWLMFWCLYQPD